MGELKDVFKADKPIIGMVHLGLLPDSPKYDPINTGMDKIVSIALEEATILEQTGMGGIQVENMWGIPYLRSENIGYETTATLAVGVHAVRDKVSIPVGAKCHMNGADCAMACAVTTGTNRICVFGWCNASVSQSGFISVMGINMSRMRGRLEADQIPALCDVNVKHGSHYIVHDRSVTGQTMGIESQDGDVVTVTGFDTDTPPSVESISKCKKPTSPPVLIGGGLNSSNVNEFLTTADGAIIGSWFKEGNNWKNPVGYDRTKESMNEVIALRQG